jgi:hypothetical protein
VRHVCCFEQDRDGVVHRRAGPARNLLAIEIGRLADVCVLARDDGERSLVEADIDGDQWRSGILRVEPHQRGHIDPTEMVGAARHADRNVGRAASGVDRIDADALRLVIPLVLRDEERRMRALNHPIQHDPDVLGLGGKSCGRGNDESE